MSRIYSPYYNCNIFFGKIHDTKINEIHISEFYKYSIKKTSWMIGICCTLIKRTCRNNNIKRWPFRKYKSILWNKEKYKQSYVFDAIIESLIIDPNIDLDELYKNYRINNFNILVSYCNELYNNID